MSESGCSSLSRGFVRGQHDLHHAHRLIRAREVDSGEVLEVVRIDNPSAREGAALSSRLTENGPVWACEEDKYPDCA